MRSLLFVLAALGACTPEPGPGPEPEDLCVTDPDGRLCTVAGTGDRASGPDDSPGTQTALYLPTSASLAPDGRLVITDFNNHRIRRLEPDGLLTTLAGSGIHAYAEEHVDARASALENPVDAQVGPDGALFIFELHGARVLRVDPADNTIATYAGSAVNPGYPGYEGDGGPALDASFSEAEGLAVGPDGAVYVADTGNHCIRAVTPDGTVDTVAGDGQPGMEDDIGRAARFLAPRDVEVHEGALYVADGGNSRIRRIDLATGETTTVAGSGTAGYAGDGGPAVEAALNHPRGLGFGPDGAMYVADSDNHVIRRVDPEDGTIDTVLGQPGEAGFDGDGTFPEDTLLSWPNGVLVSAEGDLYVVDTFNDRVRVVRGWLAR